MALMNWPPSRGPNPNAPKFTYKQGKIEREDISREDLERMGEDFDEANPKQIGKWLTWFQVEDVADLTLPQAVKILRGTKVGEEESPCTDDWLGYHIGALETIISYPLETAVRLSIDPLTVTIKRGKNPEMVSKEMRLGYFLWVVAQEYLRIYEEAEKYGIWGHALSDLGFEGIVIFEGGFTEILMGS